MAPVPFTLRQLEYFDAIATEGSLSAASHRSHVSASALALAVDELERNLQLQLFIRRKGRGVTLTSAGLRLLSVARRVLAEAESLAGDAVSTKGSLTGSFGIGCFSTLGPFFLPAVLENFSTMHPGLDLSVHESSAPELTDLLLHGRLEAALMYEVDVSPQLTSAPVGHIRPHIIISADHRLAAARRVSLSELIEEPLIVLDVQPTKQNTNHLFDRLHLSPTVAHTVGSYELARCLVGRGLGWAVMFQRPRTTRSYDGRELVELEIADDVPDTTVCLTRTTGSPRTAKFDALVDYLVQLPRGTEVDSASDLP
ncbi:LysR substrate-binding domain-containing protein [Citricoccus sp. GCM10030269]|uniref:LysR substrate-binding domain-containing protein n=1 Tax=Citricoccus sp. GCM10030269 TaxID=3273388 RepID=UPI0036154C59